jgi:pimeloyl-ACP methyl ester carboxylesterase
MSKNNRFSGCHYSPTVDDMTSQTMMPEQLVPVGAVELCVQTVGDPDHPAVLLIHGACASMVWWEDELCERIAAGGRFVIRYDQRDTGRSTSFPVGDPGYAMSDLAADAVGILDALGVTRAHVVGRSMSGGTALFLAVDHPDRVASVTFMSTTTGEDELPSPTTEFVENTPDESPDLGDVEAVVEHVTAAVLAYHGTSPLADAEHVRSLARIDVARTRDLAASMTNHFAMQFDGPRNGGFGDVACPALVVHGALDPAFPVEHGHALQAALPAGATLVVLEDTGHELPVARWDQFVEALLSHTAGRGGADAAVAEGSGS